MNRKVIKCAIIAIIAIVWVPMVGQNRLVPDVSIDDAGGGGDDHGAYMAVVKDYLLHGQLDDWDNYPFFIYTSRPSFTGEYVLTGTRKDNVLTLTQAKENLWYYFCDQLESKRSIKYSPKLVTSFQMQVPDSVINMLQLLVKSAVATSSYLFESLGCDGTTYCFESAGKAATCWSPDGRCGELVRIFDQCCRAVMNNELDSITVLMPRCREMTISFRMDYPSDFFALQQSLETTADYISLVTPEDDISLETTKDDISLVDTADYISLVDTADYTSPYYYLYLKSNHVMIEWDGADKATLQEACDEFKKKHGEDLMEFSRQLTCAHFVEERICLHPEDFVDKDFNDLYQEFLTDKSRFLQEHRNTKLKEY